MNVFGSRVRIRPTSKQDLSFLQSLWNDGAVMRFQGYPEGMQLTDACMEHWWNSTPQSLQTETSFSPLVAPPCVIERLDGPLIGELTYSIDVHERALVNVKVARAYWRQGYASESLRLALREIFATTHATRALVEPAADNLAAQMLFHRCGFTPQPTPNHPNRWECTRSDFADRCQRLFAEVG